MNRLSTKLGKLEMKNPVTVASGTFGLEYSSLYNLDDLGAIVTKTITPEVKKGNPTPRLYETECGMLNSIGLQNSGIDAFLDQSIHNYHFLNTPLIVSFSASSIHEFCIMLKKLENCDKISGYEVNISCPNVENEGIAFGVDPHVVYNLSKELSSITEKELIIKLSPNVTDIVTIAKAAEEGGADSIALINTMLGMAIDWQTGKSMIRKGIAGYSGQAIKPIALQMVYKVCKSVKIPVLAMGGIYNFKDCLEFFYAGASAVAIGTAQFSNPLCPVEIIKELDKFLLEKQLNLKDIIGTVSGIE